MQWQYSRFMQPCNSSHTMVSHYQGDGLVLCHPVSILGNDYPGMGTAVRLHKSTVAKAAATYTCQYRQRLHHRMCICKPQFRSTYIIPWKLLVQHCVYAGEWHLTHDLPLNLASLLVQITWLQVPSEVEVQRLVVTRMTYICSSR